MKRSRLHDLAIVARKRKLLIPFFTAGFPSVEGTLQLTQAAINNGADAIELGIPFSDPLADGPAIQFSSHAALESGMTISKLFDLTKSIRARTQIPILYMGYYNPLIAHGLEPFVLDGKRAGADGFIIPDLPLEESVPLTQACQQAGMSQVQLVAPTSSPARIKQLAAASPELLYAVTIAGVTGSRQPVAAETVAYLAKVKANAKGLVVAGFGVSSPELAVKLAAPVDGVVVGSALVEIIRGTSNFESALSQVGSFLGGIRTALDKISPEISRS